LTPGRTDSNKEGTRDKQADIRGFKLAVTFQHQDGRLYYNET